MDIIRKYFPVLTERQETQFLMLYPLYKELNSKINVISRNDIENLYERHVLYSLSLLKFFSFSKGTGFLDVGTGGGFPGIPLAIMLPDCKFTLVDSIGKKVRVVNEVALALGLENVNTVHENIVNIKAKYDFVISRAVTSLPGFVKLTYKNVLSFKKGGIIYLKGGDFNEELEEITLRKKVINISEEYKEDYFATKRIVYLGG